MAEGNCIEPSIQNSCRDAGPPSVKNIKRQREDSIGSPSIECRNDDRRNVSSLLPQRDSAAYLRHESIHVLDKLLFGGCGRLHHVAFVENHEESAALIEDLLRESEIVFGEEATAVQNKSDDVRIVELFVSVEDAERVQRGRQNAVGLGDSGRVDDADTSIVEFDLRAHRVACESRNTPRNEPICLQKSVEKRRFPAVWDAQNRQLQDLIVQIARVLFVIPLDRGKEGYLH